MKIYKCDKCLNVVGHERELTLVAITGTKVFWELCNSCITNLVMTMNMWFRPPKPL